MGMMMQHGPYTIPEGKDSFEKNPYSWNREANVFYIESPAYVGFSMCPTPNECNFDDFTSADDNLKAVLGVLNKFPEL